MRTQESKSFCWCISANFSPNCPKRNPARGSAKLRDETKKDNKIKLTYLILILAKERSKCTKAKT